ncbi:universal stress protein [Desulforhopalus singaporensis]|uniref:Nucleotide-binding universal stress protein, UspA family n=1 Tax=Desulforhopalus singaporensis TaxID=91360 RepID=A0A1H0TES5_9BACT|nr:universal stress protein [Desulforhopalus singaporensis]SDP52504.1 Nucleotide-binding universal stress protein, UspA family [Desulforhopalus singaporensis]
MGAITRVAVAVNFADYSAELMEYVGDIAERNSAELLAINVIDKRQIEHLRTVCEDEDLKSLTIGASFSVENYVEDETKSRMKRIEDLFHKTVPAKVDTRAIIRMGIPFEQILKVVEEENIDMVVINSRGRSTFQDFMYGTASEKIFRHCPVPVLSLNLDK